MKTKDEQKQLIPTQTLSESDARLIAAAPEFFAVVRALVGATNYENCPENGDATSHTPKLSGWLILEARKVLARAQGGR